MKTKFFILLALCVGLSVVVVKATIAEPWSFTVANKQPQGYFGASLSLCTLIYTTDGITSTQFARYTRPSTASLTDGLQWGFVDKSINLQGQVSGIGGGNVSMGTNSTYTRYLIVRMKKILGVLHK
jgi:hypothetical protein